VPPDRPVDGGHSAESALCDDSQTIGHEDSDTLFPVNLGWIWTENLRPLLEILGRALGCEFDDSDWAAFSAGVRGTDSEHGRWFEYPIGRTTVRVALEPGADEMVTVILDNGESLHHKMQWTADLLRDYHLQQER
jgi:hypothetical protein